MGLYRGTGAAVEIPDPVLVNGALQGLLGMSELIGDGFWGWYEVGFGPIPSILQSLVRIPGLYDGLT